MFIEDYPTDPIYEQDCDNCIYASGCFVVGKCPIGGPYYEEPDDSTDGFYVSEDPFDVSES